MLNTLLEKKLVTGGQVIEAPARFLWKGKILDLNYFTITSFTLEKHKNSIIEVVESISEEDVPMITFTPFEGNQKLLDWIEETLL